MKLFFIGSIHHHKPGTEQTPSVDDELLFKAAEQLGYASAAAGNRIIIGSESKNTIDYYLVKGAAKYCEENPDKQAYLEVHRPKDSKAPYTAVPSNLRVNREYYHQDQSSRHKWVVAHVRMLDLCDAVIALGGATSTRIVGNIAADRQMPIVAVSSFGGSAAELYDRLQYHYKDKLGATGALESLIAPWKSEFAQDVISLAETMVKATSEVRPHLYFLSYSWSDSEKADHVEALLRRNNRNVLRDEANVKSGGSLSRAIETLIAQADTFLALWSSSYENSSWCPNELEYAKNREAKGDRPHRIVIVTLDETEVPIRFTDSLRRAGETREQRELMILNLLKEEAS